MNNKPNEGFLEQKVGFFVLNHIPFQSAYNIQFFHIGIRTMAENDELLSFLHKIKKAVGFEGNFCHLNYKKGEIYPKKDCQTFYKNVGNNLLLVKSKIASRIQHYERQAKLALIQKELLCQLQNALSLLNGELLWLLNEGILNVYLQILHLRQKTAKMQKHLQLHALTKHIIQAMSKLLLNYFCYQQYKITTEKENRKRQAGIFSHRNIAAENNCQQQTVQPQLDYQLIKDIEESMKNKSIQEIIRQNMRKEIAKMTEQQSICRICSEKTKLANIEKHVKVCQKRSDLKQDRQTKRRRMNQLLNQIRQSLQSTKRKSLKTKENESLRTVVSWLLCKENCKKEKGGGRRSQTFISSNTNEHEAFITLAQQHLQVYGEHQTLKEIYKIQKEIILIQKQINGFQSIISNLEKNNVEIQALDKKSTRKNSKGRGSKNSLEALSTLNSLSVQDQTNCKKKVSFGQSDLSSDQDEKENNLPKCLNKDYSCFDQSFKKFQSKRSFKEKEGKQCSKIKSKNFVSLQEITFDEESSEKKISFQDFEVLKQIGKGAYGRVYMVRRKETEDIYALKLITLSDKVTEKELQLIGKQHQIYKKICGEYLAKAHFSFNEKCSHMFVIQYMPGGDMRKILEQQVYFEEEVTRFYLAQIVLAIEHLHKFNIIHRDIKPENLLLDQQGHIKLTDFGLSELRFQNMLNETKKLTQQPCNIRRTSKRRVGFRYGLNKPNLIGTPDYIAPQIINNISISNLSIDWWSLGVIAYEFMIGTRPFCAQTIEQVIQNIKSFNIEWPQVGDQEGMITQNAKDLIEKLLDTDFLNRLGANGANQIKLHPFFESIDWEGIRSSNAPFKPKVSKENQRLSYFEDQMLRQSIQRMISRVQNSNPKLRLQKFVRFDLLGSETIQSFQKIVCQKTNHLSKLKALQKLQMMYPFQEKDRIC